MMGIWRCGERCEVLRSVFVCTNVKYPASIEKPVKRKGCSWGAGRVCESRLGRSRWLLGLGRRRWFLSRWWSLFELSWVVVQSSPPLQSRLDFLDFTLQKVGVEGMDKGCSYCGGLIAPPLEHSGGTYRTNQKPIA